MDSVQICSISPEEIQLPRRTYTSTGWLIPACPRDKPFTSVVITDMMDEKKIYTEYDYRAAEVIPVPIPVAQIISDYFGNERLKQKGCFVISVDAIPSEQQLFDARAERTAWLQMLVAEGDKEYQRTKRTDNIPLFCHRAVKELGAQREWAFQAPIQLAECPACGEMVKQGVAICKSCGAILNREKAALYGIVQEEEVPQNVAQATPRGAKHAKKTAEEDGPGGI